MPDRQADGASGERQFGPYRLIQQIATGGMAEIHLAATKGVAGFEKVVALKMIHPNFSSDDHFVQMLIDEAKISVQLQHVNIAHVFDLGKVGDTYYIAMEFVDGCDLFKVLRKASEQDRYMPLEMACYIAKEVCAGLDYAHHKRDSAGRSLGIVHRDISPQNVLLSHAGEVKLVDFGIAKATMRAKQTAVGVIKGKYYYMSPEQAWGDPVDQRTDIFSAGILLYEMLTGQMLYLEEDMNRLLEMVRKADIAPPSTKRPDVPRELDRIVMRALAKKPDLRWQAAQDFGTAIERFLHSYAPDFGAGKLAVFVNEIVPPAPPPQAAPAPRTEDTARVTRGISRQSIMVSRSEFTDENSVIFRLSDLAAAPGRAGRAEARAEALSARAEPRAGADLARAAPPTATARASASGSANRVTTPSAPPAKGKRPIPANRLTTPVGSAPPRQASQRRSRDETRAARSHVTQPGVLATDATEPQVKLAPAQRAAAPAAPAATAPRAPIGSVGDSTIELGDEMLLPAEDLVEEHEGDAPDDTADGAVGPAPGTTSDATADVHGDLGEHSRAAAGPPPDEDPTQLDPEQPASGRGGRPTLPLGSRSESALPVPGPAPATPASPPAPTAARPPAVAPVAEAAPPAQPSSPQASGRFPGAPARAASEGGPVRRSRRTPGSGVPVGVAARLGDSGRMAALPLSAPVEETAPQPAARDSSGATAPVWPPAGAHDSWADDDFFGIRIGGRLDRRKLLLGALVIAVLVALGALGVAAFSGGPPARDEASLEVISIPAGARVLVDGKELGRSPLKLEHLAPGKPVTVRLELERYETWQRTEPLREPRDMKLVGSLRPIVGTLRVESAPLGAEVFLNNLSLGTTPLVRSDMNPFVDGTVEVRKQGHRPSRLALRWEGQREAKLRFELTANGN